MADEVDPGCSPVLHTDHRKPGPSYPTNSYDPPSHVPGKSRSPTPHLSTQHSAESYQPPDYATFDIIKASQYGLLERCRELVETEGVDVRVPDAENVTVLHWASINNRVPVVEYLISKGAVVDQRGGTLNATPIHWAIRQGNLETVVALMRLGADPTLEDSEGCSGLHLSAQFGHSSIMAYLLAKGMDVDLVDRNGMTPLMWASYRSFGIDSIRVILNFGASINYSDKIHKNTALHWAISASNTNAIKPLLKSGASIEATNEEGFTPEDLAVDRRNNWIVRQLQIAVFDRGTSRPSFIRSLSSNKETRLKVVTGLPFCLLFGVGIILELSPWWLYKVIFIVTLSSLTNTLFSMYRDPDENPLALGIYLATKAYMYSALFFFFWPLVNTLNVTLPFTLNSIGLFYCFIKSWLSDPGVIKATVVQRKLAIIELAESGMLKDFSKFCSTCLVRRPVRSKHCSVCNKCVARMDHHCPWINNCVGANNHHYFMGFLFFLFGVNMWYIWASIKYYNTFCGPFNNGTFAAISSICTCAPYVTFGFMNALFHTTWVGILLFCSTYQIMWLGMTTNERMNASRYRHFHDNRSGKVKSPFSVGVLQNIADFFGVSFFGLVKPTNIDWTNVYDITRFDTPRRTHEYTV